MLDNSIIRVMCTGVSVGQLDNPSYVWRSGSLTTR